MISMQLSMSAKSAGSFSQKGTVVTVDMSNHVYEMIEEMSAAPLWRYFGEKMRPEK